MHINLSIRWRWVVCLMPWLLYYNRGEATLVSTERRIGGLHRSSGQFGEEKVLCEFYFVVYFCLLLE